MNKNIDDNLIYLDTYVLQQDMRIRLPKAILNNLNIKKGITHFSIFFNKDTQELVLRVKNDDLEDLNNEWKNKEKGWNISIK